MESVDKLIKRYRKCYENSRSGNFDDDAWLQLEYDLDKFWETATDEEKKLLSDKIPMESMYMVCQGIRWDREQNKENVNG